MTIITATIEYINNKLYSVLRAESPDIQGIGKIKGKVELYRSSKSK